LFETDEDDAEEINETNPENEEQIDCDIKREIDTYERNIPYSDGTYPTDTGKIIDIDPPEPITPTEPKQKTFQEIFDDLLRKNIN